MCNLYSQASICLQYQESKLFMQASGFKDEMKQQGHIYLRFHETISRAIQLNKLIFGKKMSKNNKEFQFQHSLRVAGYIEQILDQTMKNYHMGWLLGILHDNKEQNPTIYAQKIDWVVNDLFLEEQKEIKLYVDLLSSDKSLKKGQQKRQQVLRMDKMPLLPSWIIIYDKMDNCKHFMNDPVGKTEEELLGYYSISFLIYQKACKNHHQIRNNMSEENKLFYETLLKKIGSRQKVDICSQKYYKTY